MVRAARKSRAPAPALLGATQTPAVLDAAQAPALLGSAQAPRSELELLARAAGLAGRTVAELAALAGAPTPPRDQRRAKGLVGRLLERVLGAHAGNAPLPDFTALGIELKTIPLDRAGRPLESTFVCTVPLQRMAELEWEGSPVQRKLQRVLWIPLESGRDLELGARRIGTAKLWSPSPEEEALLRADFELLASALGRGESEQLSARAGRCLQVRPKGANRDSRVRGSDEHGAPVSMAPRGFYLRASFTARLFVGYRET
jgi:DNA mismatch repair protein MutH